MRLICPTKAQPGIKHDILGCGHAFEAEPDHEGFVDCPECAIYFKAEQGLVLPVKCAGGCGVLLEGESAAKMNRLLGSNKPPVIYCAACHKSGK